MRFSACGLGKPSDGRWVSWESVALNREKPQGLWWKFISIRLMQAGSLQSSETA